MILSDIGYGLLLLILAAALWATILSVLGAHRRRPELVASARNALLVTAGLSTLSAVALLALLFTHDFGVQYVYEHVSTYLKPAYVLSAFWAGQEGSQLLWLWMLAIVTGVLVLRRPTWDRELRPYAMAVLAVTQALFAFLLILLANPFALKAVPEAEGISLNPLLQNFWMIIHPPIVFVAYALWTVPAAYAIAALWTGQLDATWLRGTRRWTLAAWASLGIGILVGAWWAYLELGWGGYWGWDPVENSSFIPWLVGTAFVHSTIIQQRRDMFRAWNVILAVLTFLLTVFATFVTRSGYIDSVHAFTESPIGWYYLSFILLLLAITVGLALARSRELKGAGQLGDLFSREFMFLLTNLLFLGSAAAVLLGTLWPTLTQIVRGSAASLTADNYNRFMGPLGLLLVLLIGLCPVLEWRKTTADRFVRNLYIQVAVGVLTAVVLILSGVRELWAVVAFSVTALVGATAVLQLAQGVVSRMRTAGENVLQATARAVSNNRRRYGGQLVHLSILLIVMGIIGSQAFQTEVQIALTPGEQVEVEGYTLAYRDFTYNLVEEGGHKCLYQAELDVYRGQRKLATIRPERNLHSSTQCDVTQVALLGQLSAVTEVALRSQLNEDLYVILASLDANGLAAFQVLVTPLVIWLWIGGGVLIAGTLISAWPARTAAAGALAKVIRAVRARAGGRQTPEQAGR